VENPVQTTENSTIFAGWKLVLLRLTGWSAMTGFTLYSVFAPHSIAAAEIALALVGAAWILRLFLTGRTYVSWNRLDLPILLFVSWTVLSSLLSVEPRVSIAKLQSVCVLFLLYLVRSFVTRRTAVFLVVLMITSGAAGVLWSVIDLLRGRGIIVESVAPDSPFREVEIQQGDAVWRVGGRRVGSIAEIDRIIQHAPAGQKLDVSIIRHGEHADFSGFIVSDTLKSTPAPSGLQGSRPTHRFRASGWTRHYETFCETLQILAQLALGLAIAGFRRPQKRFVGGLALAAALVLTLGVAFTAMRSVLVALMIGSIVIAWRTNNWRLRALSLAVVVVVAGLGLYSVASTRTRGALELRDDSASLRLQVAKVGLSRIDDRPIFGHGMDSIKSHWHEWGFPGNVVIHLHSTPLELAFERGIPALLFWVWIIVAFWRTASERERRVRDSSDLYRWGVLLGSLGAISGFFASSLVNYNFGDGEVALVFWWLMGITVVLSSDRALDRSANGKEITATDGPYQHHLF
jgi:hypothetical protein